jgi:hypothetical protein
VCEREQHRTGRRRTRERETFTQGQEEEQACHVKKQTREVRVGHIRIRRARSGFALYPT